MGFRFYIISNVQKTLKMDPKYPRFSKMRCRVAILHNSKYNLYTSTVSTFHINRIRMSSVQCLEKGNFSYISFCTLKKPKQASLYLFLSVCLSVDNFQERVFVRFHDFETLVLVDYFKITFNFP